MKNKFTEKVEVKKLDGSRVEITGTISKETFASYREKALKNINEEITVDGFRKGKVPESVLVQKVGDMTILEEMAELALSEAYPEIIEKEKIDVIGRPNISITKIAKDSPLEFKIISDIIPEIKLPDYKKIAKENIKTPNEKDFTVTDVEVDEAIEKIKKSHENHDGHEHGSDIEKEQVKKYLVEDKKNQFKEKNRIEITEAILEKTKIDLPEVMIYSETQRIESQFEADIKNMGVKLEDYLNHAKKTLDDLRKEWRPFAEKKAKLQLVLNKISDDENIRPSKEEIENEVNHILEHYKDADPEKVFTYAESVLTNHKVYEYLENQKTN